MLRVGNGEVGGVARAENSYRPWVRGLGQMGWDQTVKGLRC